MTTQIFSISCCGYTLFSFDREDYKLVSPRARKAARRSTLKTQNGTVQPTEPLAERTGIEIHDPHGQHKPRTSSAQRHVPKWRHQSDITNEDWMRDDEEDTIQPDPTPKWPPRGSSLPSRRSSLPSVGSIPSLKQATLLTKRSSAVPREASMLSVYHDASEEPLALHETANPAEGLNEQRIGDRDEVVISEAVAVKIVDWHLLKETQAAELAVLREAMAVPVPKDGGL